MVKMLGQPICPVPVLGLVSHGCCVRALLSRGQEQRNLPNLSSLGRVPAPPRCHRDEVL